MTAEEVPLPEPVVTRQKTPAGHPDLPYPYDERKPTPDVDHAVRQQADDSPVRASQSASPADQPDVSHPHPPATHPRAAL